MTLRLQAMAVAIVAGVGVFLGAQELRLIPPARSEETATFATYSAGSESGAYNDAIAAHPDDFMTY